MLQQNTGFWVSQQQDLTQIVINEIDRATSNIRIGMYKFRNEEIYKAITRATQRGIVVNMILDKKQNKQGDSPAQQLERDYPDLVTVVMPKKKEISCEICHF